jgi:hypothetical protein
MRLVWCAGRNLSSRHVEDDGISVVHGSKRSITLPGE